MGYFEYINNPWESDRMKARFQKRLAKIIPARWHMTLICFITLACGILFSKTLLYLQMSHPMIRYGLAIGFAYATFFALIKIWLLLLFKNRSHSQPNDYAVEDVVADVALNVNSPGPTSWSGGGGQSSGGGASESWGETSKSSSFGEDASSALLDSDAVAIVILIVAVCTAIFGSSFYFIYQAPEILFEAAFEGVLVASLFRRGKKLQAEGWRYSVFKRTWKPFALVLVTSLLFGYLMKAQCPAATSFADYRAMCWNKN